MLRLARMKPQPREQPDQEDEEEAAEPTSQPRGPRARFETLKADVKRAQDTAELALEVAGIKTPTRKLGKKSMALSGLLSLVLGPFGWLYAAPLKEALPVALAYALILYFTPSLLFLFIAGAINVVSAIAGLLYAWGFNSAGKRVPLFLKEKDAPTDPPLRKLFGRYKSK